MKCTKELRKYNVNKRLVWTQIPSKNSNDIAMRHGIARFIKVRLPFPNKDD